MEQRAKPDGGILIVDDHPLTVDLLLDLLAGAFPGLATRSATSAEEALEFCRVVLPQLIIMDIRLPGANGIEATRKIKSLSPQVSVIVHSNHDQKIYRQQCKAAGADAFVSKARTHVELVSAILPLVSPPPESMQ